MSGLDETVVDPLSAVEREALTKLREHDAVVSALRDDIASIQQRNASGWPSLSELKRLVEEAERVEKLVGAPQEVLARKTIVEAGWPSVDLTQARKILGAVDDYEAATAAAREDLKSVGEDQDPQPLCTTLTNLLGAWARLEDTEADMRKDTDAPFSKIDLMMQNRATTISPLCAGLLDKAADVYTSLKSKAAEDVNSAEWASSMRDSLHKLLTEERSKGTLETLNVALPSPDVLADICGESSAAPTTAIPMNFDVSPSRTAGDAAAAAAAAVNAAVAAMEGASAAMEGRTPNKSSSPFAIGAGAALDYTVPEAPSMKSKSIEHSYKSGAPSEAASERSAAGAHSNVPASSGQRYVVPSGSAELWHAVHIGDEPAVQRFAATGACDGKTRDASGHSVMWHAIAFDHMRLANFMLDTFPPDTEKGVDVTEIHTRKGDTMLHLLCQSKNFGADTAHLFKRVASVAPDEIFMRPNQAGLTFFQIAAAQLNFWVLTFVLKNFHEQAKALVCDENHAALRSMSEVVPQPTAPEFTPPNAFPEHFHVQEMLQQDENGLVPYADVAFDVGPESLGSAAGRFLAHRIIVAATSPVLMEELTKLPLTHLAREGVHAAVFRVDPRISKEVWRSALRFMYTGVIDVEFKDDAVKMAELFRACVTYQLPQPLLDFTQACLYPLLPTSPPDVALDVFSLCAGAAADEMGLSSAREASTYIMLRSAHKLFEAHNAQEACRVLEAVVQAVEKVVFDPKKAAAQQEASAAAVDRGAGAEAAAAAAGMQQDPRMMQQTGAGMDMTGRSMGGTPDMQAYQEMLMAQTQAQAYQEMMMMAQQPQAQAQEMMMARTAQAQADNMMAQTMLSQSTYGQQEIMAQVQAQAQAQEILMARQAQAQGQQDMMAQSMRSQQDPMAQSMRSQQDPMAQSMMMSQNPRGQMDMLSQSMQNPQDMMAQSMMMQNARGQADMLSQTMPPGVAGGYSQGQSQQYAGQQYSQQQAQLGFSQQQMEQYGAEFGAAAQSAMMSQMQAMSQQGGQSMVPQSAGNMRAMAQQGMMAPSFGRQA